MTTASRPRWYQFSLKRLLIVMAAAPPLLAGGYFLARELGTGTIVAIGAILWLALIIDLFANRAISTSGKVIWLLMMLLSCPVATLLYATVRLHGWLLNYEEPSQPSLPNS